MNDSRATLVDSLAQMLHQTAEDHHVAFQQTDGADPDWASWYADRLLELGLDAKLGMTVPRSDLIDLLVLAAREQRLQAPDADWERWYADFFITRFVH